MALKLDDGREVLGAFVRLFKLFLHFDGAYANEYKKCMLLNLLLWTYHINNDMPIWQMVQQNASVCNEEAGELAFSVLGRTIGSNSSRTDIELVNRHFILSKLKLDVAKDLNFDISDNETVQVHSHTHFPPESREVARVAAHFYVVVASLRRNHFTHYPTKPEKLMFEFKDKAHADKKVVSSKDEDVKEWFMTHSIPKLTELIQKTKKAMSGEWLSQHKEHWPIPEVVEDPKQDDAEEVDADVEDDGKENDEDEDEEKEVKVPDPAWVDRDPSPPRPPIRKYGKKNQRQKKRKRPTAILHESSEEDPETENKEPQQNAESDSKEINVRPKRNAKPRYQMVDEGSEAGSVFEKEAGWNGNMNSEDDESEDDE